MGTLKIWGSKTYYWVYESYCQIKMTKKKKVKKNIWKISKKSRAENYTIYNRSKNDFDAIYDNTAKGIRIRNKFNCYNTVRDSKSFFS